MIARNILALAFFAVAATATVATTAPKLNHIKKIQWLYGNFSHGYDIAVLRKIPPGIFHKSAGGSILPLGIYDNLDETIDYFYGQSAPFGPQPNAPPTEYIIRNYVEDGNMVSATVDVTIRGPGNALGDTPQSHYFTLSGFYEFSSASKSATIKRYNLVVPRGIEYYRAMYPTSWALQDPTPEYKNYIKNTICARHNTYCTKTINGAQPDRQFSSTAECRAFLDSIPFGVPEMATDNSVMCRWVHSANIAARTVHCPHIGVTGGPFCKYHPYDDFYNVPTSAPMYAAKGYGKTQAPFTDKKLAK